MSGDIHYSDVNLMERSLSRLEQTRELMPVLESKGRIVLEGEFVERPLPLWELIERIVSDRFDYSHEIEGNNLEVVLRRTTAAE